MHPLYIALPIHSEDVSIDSARQGRGIELYAMETCASCLVKDGTHRFDHRIEQFDPHTAFFADIERKFRSWIKGVRAVLLDETRGIVLTTRDDDCIATVEDAYPSIFHRRKWFDVVIEIWRDLSNVGDRTG